MANPNDNNNNQPQRVDVPQFTKGNEHKTTSEAENKELELLEQYLVRTETPTQT